MNYKTSMKLNTIKAKLLRFLGITKPIPLTPEEVKWIKLIKGHYVKEVPYKNLSGIDSLKPMFESIYGWSADDDYEGFLDCMLKKLLILYLRIQDDQSGSNLQLRQIIQAATNDGYFLSPIENPSERVILELMSQIRHTKVISDGITRFHL